MDRPCFPSSFAQIHKPVVTHWTVSQERLYRSTLLEMDSEQEVERHLSYIKISAVLVGIATLSLLILWVTSLYRIRRENDPARVAFTYMNVSFPLAILCVNSFPPQVGLSLTSFT